MKISTAIAALLLLTAATSICRASLGDTEAQCLAKYGPEFDVQDRLGFDRVGDRAASFNTKTPAGTFVVNVTFLNGIASLEKFTNSDASIAITEDQKKALLHLESAGLEWSEKDTSYRTSRTDVTAGSQSWARADGATAICWMFGKLTSDRTWGEIDIATRQYAAAQRVIDQRDGGR